MMRWGPSKRRAIASTPKAKWIPLVSVLLCLLLIGAFVGISPAKLSHNAHVQRLIARAIQEAGGRVTYRPAYNTWLVRLAREMQRYIGTFLGPICVDDIDMVFVVVNKSNRGILSGVGSLKRVRTLVICGNGMMNEDMWILDNKIDLKMLGICDTSVTDAGLVHLRNLPNLEILDIHGNHINDAGLRNICLMRRLKYLHIEGTGITDASVEMLKTFRCLKEVDLARTKMTPEGISELRQALSSRIITVEGNSRLSEQEIEIINELRRRQGRKGSEP